MLAARLRGFAASARHPSPVGSSLGLPSRSSPKASEGWMACRAEARSQTGRARLRGFAASARHPSPVRNSLGLPSRSSPKASEGWMACRAEARSRQVGPAFAASPLRRGILRLSETRLVYRAEARRRRAKDGGPDRDRTGDLVNAIHARSQLRHWPTAGVTPYCSRAHARRSKTLAEMNAHRTFRSRSFSLAFVKRLPLPRRRISTTPLVDAGAQSSARGWASATAGIRT